MRDQNRIDVGRPSRCVFWLGGAALPTAILLAALFCSVSASGELDDSSVEFFESKIRPVLIEHCYRCHAASAETIRGGLSLDTRDGIRRGGDSGPAVTPGRPAESHLLDAIRYESFEMPPERRLPDSVIADFDRWIRWGAPDPRDGPASPPPPSIDIEAGRHFWAFQPPRQTEVAQLQDAAWPRTEVDRYILERLEARGLQPVADADRGTLIRRASYALIGLPPSTSEIDEFLHDPAPLSVAFPAVVDRLLASKHFGERWGRHWLDVVRFAESSGGGRTLLFPDAWRYRDYVVGALNDDLPYDHFVKQQIAGDLMPASDWRQKRTNLTATAFLVLGPTNYELQDKDVLEMDIVDEQLDTMGKAFLGMTIGCARCHDHKFDPIPTRDYYALAGILASTQSVIHANVSRWNETVLPLSPEDNATDQRYENQIAAQQRELKSLQIKQKKAGGAQTSADGSEPIDPAPEITASIADVQKKIKRLQAARPARNLAMAVVDRDAVGDIPLAIRGSVHNPGPIVPRGVLQVAATGDAGPMPEDQSGRRQLADWLASPDNPLTARVLVNRVWYWLFGAGLVRTVDNFGSTGERPSHPELLDYLAIQLVQDDWSVKRLIRRLMLSRVYQLSTVDNGPAIAVDPANRLLWRQNRQRLDAESIRDTLLLVGGVLDRTLGGPNIIEGTKSEYGYRFASRRRSVYVPVFRNRLPPIFQVFDFADPNIQVGKRSTSTTAPQALLLMNHPLVMEQCEAAAQRLLASRERSTFERIDRLYRQVLGRLPSGREVQLARRFVGDRDDVLRWGLLYQTLFQSVDFRYLN